jgi:hypothetical protein
MAAFAAFLLPEYRPVHGQPFERSKMVKNERGLTIGLTFLALHKRKVAIGLTFGLTLFVFFLLIQGYKLPLF